VHNYANELVGKREGVGGRKSGWKNGLHVAHRENFRCGSVRESEEQAKQYIHIRKRKPLPGCIDIFTKVRPAYTYI